MGTGAAGGIGTTAGATLGYRMPNPIARNLVFGHRAFNAGFVQTCVSSRSLLSPHEAFSRDEGGNS
jgi:hypothetical protein